MRSFDARSHQKLAALEVYIGKENAKQLWEPREAMLEYLAIAWLSPTLEGVLYYDFRLDVVRDTGHLCVPRAPLTQDQRGLASET